MASKFIRLERGTLLNDGPTQDLRIVIGAPTTAGPAIFAAFLGSDQARVIWRSPEGDDLPLQTERLSPTSIRALWPTAWVPLAEPPALLFTAHPWHEAEPWNLLRSERTLFLSACGFLGSEWHDGSLAHVYRDGKVASLVPPGGPASLTVPFAPMGPGLSLESALKSACQPKETLHRCLLAASRDLWQSQTKPLRLTLDKLDAASALALVLTREAMPAATLELYAKAPLSPPWRRLCENLGIAMQGSEFNGTTRALAALATLIPPERITELASYYDALGPMVPAKIYTA